MRTRSRRGAPLQAVDENAEAGPRVEKAPAKEKKQKKQTDTNKLDEALQEVDTYGARPASPPPVVEARSYPEGGPFPAPTTPAPTPAPTAPAPIPAPAVRKACSEIDDAVEDAKVALMKAKKLAIAKLPKDVRSMTLDSFLASGGDVSEIISRHVEERIASMEAALGTCGPATGAARGTRTAVKRSAPGGAGRTVAAGPRARRQRTGGAPEITTPAPSRAGAGATGLAAAAVAPGTSSRMPRVGETLFSENGSPLGFTDGGGIVTPMVAGGGSRLPSAVKAQRGAAVAGKISVTSVGAGEGGRARSRTTRARARRGVAEVPETIAEGDERDGGEGEVVLEIDGQRVRLGGAGGVVLPDDGDHAGLVQKLGALFHTLGKFTGLAGE